MTAITTAFAALRARAEALITLPLYWAFEDNQIPDNPVAFVYCELISDPGSFIEIGGGRGSNRYRHIAEFNAYVFVPRGQGMASALTNAESVATIFRSFRGSGVSCNGASVHPVGEGEALNPPGFSSAAGNYSCVIVSIPLTFDQIS